jgi:hypothetical protein
MIKEDKPMKKIIALVLALLVAMSMTAAFAEGEVNLIPNSGKVENPTAGGTVTFEKTIILFNDEGLDIYEPNIVYSYEITPVTASEGTTVTDTREHTAQVYSGTPLAVTGSDSVVSSNTATATFTTGNGLKDAETTGSQDTKPVSFTFDATKFPHAGIYRFTITETTDSLTNAGIERPTGYVTTENLDVYVKNGDNGLEIYGFVMFDNANPATESITTADEAGAGSEQKKSSGFTPGGPTTGSEADPTDFTNDTYCDHYKTINLTVEKTVTGSLGDKTNEFPFAYTLTLPTAVKAAVKYDYTQTGATGRTAVEIAANGATSTIGTAAATSLLNLKNGDTFQIIGVPFGTTFSINEYNNTPDLYTTTATGEGMTVTGGDSQNFAASTALTTAIEGTENNSTWAAGQNKITVTNDMTEVSPTGVVLRFAPYAAMLIAGLALLVLARKRRTDKDED